MLAKIFGFYTIRIRSVEDKRVLLNLDVLVMEHLFYGATPQITQVGVILSCVAIGVLF